MSDFIRWLNQELNRRGWSQNELGRRAGITGAAVSLVTSEKQAPTFSFCAAIAKPLEMRPEEVFRKAALLPPLRGDPDELSLRELEDIAVLLTPRERQLVTEFALWRLNELREREQAQAARGRPAAGSKDGAIEAPS